MKVRVEDFDDFFLRVETTNRCNYNCSFCPHDRMTRAIGNMSIELFKKIMKEAANVGIKNIDIRNFGEPLLDNGLEEKISIAKQYGMDYIILTTNASLLTKDRYVSLANAGLDHISISLSPKKEYMLTRQKSFEIVWANLLDLEPIRNKIPVTVHIIATEISTEKEILLLERDLTRIGYKWVRDFIHNWAEGDRIQHDKACKRLWDTITIYWDGKVPLCCLDYDGKHILGDLNKKSMSDVINSEEYMVVREQHINHKYPLLCETCNFIKV